jgi:signal transduction histidine kinase
VGNIVPTECCWQKELIAAEECPFITADEGQLLFDRKQRFLRRCLECPRLLEDLRRPAQELAGLTEVFPYAIEEILALRARLQEEQGLLEARGREIKFLHEVGLVLQTSVDKGEVIAMALTAVTAGQGFGLNRAILLLVDRSDQNLNGYFAVGPRHREEAAHIWKELEEHDLTLREMAQHFFEKKMTAERERFSELLEILSVPLAAADHPFIQVLNAQLSRHIPDLWQEPGFPENQREALGVNELVLVPLVSKNRRIGLLLADNLVSGRPITAEDLQSLETFAQPMAFAIERANLYEQLQQELTRVQAANRRLHEQQETIVRMEKMALVGNLTANIAHSIRNPLTIIGGFARTLIRSTPEDDSKRRHIESILREARRLDEVLQEVLVHAESLHPTLDLWDVNQLVAGTYAGLREDLELAGVESRLELAPVLPQVKLDYKKLGYCLRALLGNSLERLPRGGVLTLATRFNAGWVEIVLGDNGPPLAGEALRAARETAPGTAVMGADLGLSLCARILAAHQGKFSVDSSPESGTVFTISLVSAQGGTL